MGHHKGSRLDIKRKFCKQSFIEEKNYNCVEDDWFRCYDE